MQQSAIASLHTYLLSNGQMTMTEAPPLPSIKPTSRLALTPATQPVYNEMLAELKQRSAKHELISYGFLAAMIFAIIVSFILVALARAVLGGDIERIRRNEELLVEYDRQKGELV